MGSSTASGRSGSVTITVAAAMASDVSGWGETCTISGEMSSVRLTSNEMEEGESRRAQTSTASRSVFVSRAVTASSRCARIRNPRPFSTSCRA